jgi:hypothetical protein
VGPKRWYDDTDGDGKGNPAIVLDNCDKPTGFVDNPDDADPACAAGHRDVCNECDGPGIPAGKCNCAGAVEDACHQCGGPGIPKGACDCDGTAPRRWYEDKDGDGKGDPAVILENCTQPSGFVENSSDSDPGCEIPRDQCHVCHGTGIPAGKCDCQATAPDVCNVCFGDGKSCLGCDGVPNSGKTLDACGKCGGDNSSCAGCDGKPGSGKVVDICGVCGGTGFPANTCSCQGALPPTWYADVDGDGKGDPAVSQVACDQPSGYVNNGTDPYPGCNGVPDICNACNGPGWPTDTCSCAGLAKTLWYQDLDNDGLGDPAKSVRACTQPAGYVSNPQDTDPLCAPGHRDACGQCDGPGIPAGKCDCQGHVLDVCQQCGGSGWPTGTCNCAGALPGNWYGDSDNDGKGDPAVVLAACNQPGGYVANASDTDPTCGSARDACGTCGGTTVGTCPLVGKYAVRSTVFAKGKSGSTVSGSKAINFTLVDISVNGDGTLRLVEQSCYSESQPITGTTVYSWSKPEWAQAMPPVERTLTRNPNGDGTWIRTDAPYNLGWSPSRRPGTCSDSDASATVAPLPVTPTWLWASNAGSTCVCNRSTDAMPPFDKTAPYDCRLLDTDHDGYPGVSVFGSTDKPAGPDSNAGGFSWARMMLASIPSGRWTITPNAQRNHTATVADTGQSSIIGCTGGGVILSACSAVTGQPLGTVCAERFNKGQFKPVDATYTCSNVVTNRDQLFNSANDGPLPTDVECPPP